MSSCHSYKLVITKLVFYISNVFTTVSILLSVSDIEFELYETHDYFGCIRKDVALKYESDSADNSLLAVYFNDGNATKPHKPRDAPNLPVSKPTATTTHNISHLFEPFINLDLCYVKYK